MNCPYSGLNGGTGISPALCGGSALGGLGCFGQTRMSDLPRTKPHPCPLLRKEREL